MDKRKHTMIMVPIGRVVYNPKNSKRGEAMRRKGFLLVGFFMLCCLLSCSGTNKDNIKIQDMSYSITEVEETMQESINRALWYANGSEAGLNKALGGQVKQWEIYVKDGKHAYSEVVIDDYEPDGVLVVEIDTVEDGLQYGIEGGTVFCVFSMQLHSSGVHLTHSGDYGVQAGDNGEKPYLVYGESEAFGQYRYEYLLKQECDFTVEQPRAPKMLPFTGADELADAIQNCTVDQFESAGEEPVIVYIQPFESTDRYIDLMIVTGGEETYIFGSYDVVEERIHYLSGDVYPGSGILPENYINSYYEAAAYIKTT